VLLLTLTGRETPCAQSRLASMIPPVITILCPYLQPWMLSSPNRLHGCCCQNSSRFGRLGLRDRDEQNTLTAVCAMSPENMHDSARQVLRKAGNDIGAAAEELTLLEAEHAGQQKVVTATRKAAVAAKQPTVCA